MIISKLHILYIATVIILFTATSEGGVASRANPDSSIKNFCDRAGDKLQDLIGDYRSETEATSTETYQACLINQAALYKRQGRVVRDLASDLKRVAVFCNEPTPTGCLDSPLGDYQQERLKNSQYNAIVFVESYGGYRIVPIEGSGENPKKPEPGIDGKFHVAGIGFMISECLLLTNKHVAYVKSKRENVIDLEIQISQRQKGPDGRYSKLFTTKGKVVAEAVKSLNEDKRIEDLVVIRLEQPSPDKAAVIPTCDMKVVQASRSKAVSLATFLPDEKPYGYNLMGQKRCTIYGNVNEPGGPWKTDCPSLAGTSGTPALVTIADGPNKGKLCSPGIIQGDNALENYMKLDPDVAYNVLIPFSVAMPKNKLDEIEEKYKCAKATHL